MNKAILVIDIPECCGECPLCIADEYNTSRECCMKYKGYVNAKSKPTWCPLKPLPTKYDLDIAFDYNVDYERGYNACVDEILEKQENEND